MLQMDADKPKERARYWLDAVVLQARRLGSESEHVDAHFFAIALAKAVSWLDKCPVTKEEERDQIDSFLRRFSKEAKTIRNMLEHEEDYLSGKGRKQWEYMKSVKLNQGRLSATLPPFTIVHHDEGLSLAGRVSINEALQISEALSEALRGGTPG
jgi:hypothetical protein